MLPLFCIFMQLIYIFEIGSFTVKTDFWGKKTYYDEFGKSIGEADTDWLGIPILVKDGKKIGTIKEDELGRETITIESNSLFGTNKTLIDSQAPEDWEYCDNCGEWDGGEDNADCDFCDFHNH